MQVPWDQIVTYYLLYSLGGLAILLTLIHMLYRRRSTTSIAAWLLFMIVAPYLFVIIYFFFGIRKRSWSKEKSPLAMYAQDQQTSTNNAIDTLLRNNGIPASSSDNDLIIYTNPTEAYQRLYAALKDAKHSISISTYILKKDIVTTELFDLLIERSKAGVDIRIIADAFGSAGIYLWQTPLNRLKKAGIEVSFFMPLFSFPFQNRLNLRYHRKIYLVDNEVLFSGGMNLAKEYMGPNHMEKRWTDLLYRCKGSLVTYYINLFESDWAYTQELSQQKVSSSTSSRHGNCELQMIPSGPDITNDALLEAIVYGIHNVLKRVWIVTPYFVPDELIIKALLIAKHRGIDIKLITPKESDNIIADLVRSSYMRQLQEWGIDVALYEGPMLHAKAILFDNETVLLGSGNLDNRSLLLNYEVATMVYSKAHVNQIDLWMKELLRDSSFVIEPAGKIRCVFENLMRIFALQL
ncbi:phospholipase D-like domain-containing protein [Campylobacterota bacterium]